jgi:UDP-N-acetylmuramate--alanine ligase
VPDHGYVIGCSDDPLVAKLMGEDQSCTILSAIPLKMKGIGKHMLFNTTARVRQHFKVSFRGKDMGKVTLYIPGKHNVYNSLAALAAAHAVGIPFDICRDALQAFKGTHRRMEFKGKLDDVTIVDDYAHHPAEIRATLEAVKNYPHNRIWCLFQPHTYTRTKMLFEDFVHALTGVDQVIITDIYSAREKDTGEIHSRDLAQSISRTGQACIYMQTFEQIVDYLKEKHQPRRHSNNHGGRRYIQGRGYVS